jgi:hypothetical protein
MFIPVAQLMSSLVSDTSSLYSVFLHYTKYWKLGVLNVDVVYYDLRSE